MYEMAIYTSMYRLQCMGNGRSSTPYLPFQHHLTSHHLRPHPYGLRIVGNIYYITPKCPPPFARPRAACWRNPPWASTIRPSLTMHTPPRREQASEVLPRAESMHLPTKMQVLRPAIRRIPHNQARRALAVFGLAQFRPIRDSRPIRSGRSAPVGVHSAIIAHKRPGNMHPRPSPRLLLVLRSSIPSVSSFVV